MRISGTVTKRYSTWLLIASVCLALFSSRCDAGQTSDWDAPANSPRWWTLSNEVTPSQLRATLLDRSAHRARHERAIEAGLRPALTKAGLDTTSFFVSGEQTPELIPMWLAFSTFSVRSLAGTTWLSNSEERLTAYAITPASRGTIIELARSQCLKAQEEAVALAEDQQAFVQILRDARRELDGQSYLEVRSGNLEPLRGKTRLEVGELHRLHKAWKDDAYREASVRSIVWLEANLPAADWDKLKRFLRVEIASSLSLHDTDDTTQQR